MRLAHAKQCAECNMNGTATETGSKDYEIVRSESAFASVNTDPSDGFKFMENGRRAVDRSKPLKFTDAVRIHESLSAHNVSL